VALALNPALPPTGGATGVIVPDTTTLTGQTPTIVVNGQATLLGVHAAGSPLTINVSLPLQNQAALQTYLANEAGRGIYLTQEQFDATYGAPAAQVQAVTQWATAAGLQPIFTSGDNTLITLRGSTAAVAAALQVTINDYRRSDGTLFYANDRDATVPTALGITAISGLNNIPRWHVLQQPAMRALFRSGGYFPSDFRTAYDVAGHGYDGTGQTIGFTLWGTSVPNSDLAAFAGTTGDVAMSAGTGPDQIEWIPVNGGSSATDALVETAMDVESAHGIATHAHLKYWLGDEVCSGGLCGGSDTGLEDAIAAAANDSSLHVVSNSWGGGEAPSTSDPFTSATTNSFEHAVAVGTTFYFGSGDNGSDSGGSGLPSYPADSQYVVAVGGTTLNTTGNFAYSSESAWSGSGGGCSTIFTRPSWQTGVGAATCSGRAVPDVAADADPNTGAYVYVQGTGQQVAGTSLATPLFAGMAAVADRYAAQNSLARIGWAAPKIYSLANSGSYSSAFHDITSGNNGYPAGPGWDEATGWGSIDWWNWVRAIVGAPTGPTATPTSPVMTATATATHTPRPTPTSTPQSNATMTNTPRPTATGTPLQATATNTPRPTATNTPQTTATRTNTPRPTATNTPVLPVTATPTNTSRPTATNTPLPGATATNTPRLTATNTPASACAGDGTCLTGLSASATSVPVNSNVILTATTNTDVGPTVWYIDIVDQTGTVIQSCGTGSSCAVTVSAGTATSRTYTAWLSTSPTDLAGGGPRSNSVTVTWTGGATATATNTPNAVATNTPRPTATNTPLPGATATSTPRPTATSTPISACASDGTCLTGLSASATSVPVNSNVILTATTNTDVGPTVWYIDIVDQTGTVIQSCGTGSSCAVTVSAGTATSRTYTAWLSTSPTDLAGGGPRSNSVTVTWTS
jgi:kumamolisin